MKNSMLKNFQNVYLHYFTPMLHTKLGNCVPIIKCSKNTLKSKICIL